MVLYGHDKEQTTTTETARKGKQRDGVKRRPTEYAPEKNLPPGPGLYSGTAVEREEKKQKQRKEERQ